MKPIEFKGMNTTFAKDQPEYLPLPALVIPEENGMVISCWKFTWKERLRILWTGRMWFSQLAFGQALQPQLPSIECPFELENET